MKFIRSNKEFKKNNNEFLYQHFKVIITEFGTKINMNLYKKTSKFYHTQC